MPKRTGLGEFITELFEKNEKLPAKKRLIDPKIKKVLQQEFGKKPTFLDISNLRSMYNAGKFNKNKKPKVQSHRFNVDGSIMEKHERYPKEVGPVDGTYKKLSPKEKAKVKLQQAKYRDNSKRNSGKKAKVVKAKAKVAKAPKVKAKTMKAKPSANVFKARKAA